MNSRQEWIEVQHLVWVCHGCSKQCLSCGSKPIKEEEMNQTKWTVITEHWYMCKGCCFLCKAIGFRHPMVDGDSCGGSFGRRQEIQQLLKEREKEFLEKQNVQKTRTS